MFIAEKDIEIETVQVDLGSGEQFSDAFMKLNPDCVVPVLELDDGTCISEVVAICDYLEAQYAEPALMGSNAAERAQILMWNCKVEQQGLYSVMDAFRNWSRGMKDRALQGRVSYAQIPELAERGRARTAQFFERLETHLADSEYVVGARFSMADITALIAVDFAARVKLLLPERALNVRRWYEQVSTRPSASA
jgi:glutathione S-transferase